MNDYEIIIDSVERLSLTFSLLSSKDSDVKMLCADLINNDVGAAEKYFVNDIKLEKFSNSNEGTVKVNLKKASAMTRMFDFFDVNIYDTEEKDIFPIITLQKKIGNGDNEKIFKLDVIYDKLHTSIKINLGVIKQKLQNLLERIVRTIKDIKRPIMASIQSSIESGQANVTAYESNLEKINEIFKTTIESILIFCEKFNETYNHNDLFKRNERMKKILKNC